MDIACCKIAAIGIFVPRGSNAESLMRLKAVGYEDYQIDWFIETARKKDVMIDSATDANDLFEKTLKLAENNISYIVKKI